MDGTEIALPTRGGALAGLDFHGDGPSVLLVHGSGHNAAVWTEVAAGLAGSCRLVAVDVRGHGQTTLDSTRSDQYWRDLGDVVRSLGWERPVLVGHSTGGYAITAATAAGLVSPAALCVVDGVVLDDRSTAVAAYARLRTGEALDQLRTAMRYGWRADDEEMRGYVEDCAQTADTDWLNVGASPELVRTVTRRSFLSQGGTWLRRPALDEIKVVSSAEPTDDVYPSVDLYDNITCPLTVVLPSDGFYAQRRADVQNVINAGPNRTLVDVASNHNMPMTHPTELAKIIESLLPTWD